MTTPQIKPPTSIATSALFARERAAELQSGGDQHTKLVNQTEKWVAQTFYGTLLKQMRESPLHSDLMDGGNGGKTFQAMLDQRLADHMSRHAGGKLVRAIVKKIEAAQGAKHYEKASKLKASPASPNPALPRESGAGEQLTGDRRNAEPALSHEEPQTRNAEHSPTAHLRRLHVHQVREHA